MKKQESGFLWALLAPLDASIVQPIMSSVEKSISRGRFRRTSC